MYSSTHCDTDANVHTDIHANVYVDADNHPHIDAHTVLQCLYAAYHEVNREANDAFPEFCHLALCGLAGNGDVPSGRCWPNTVTDGDSVPDRDAGTSHRHASAALTHANPANRYTSSTNGHAHTNAANRYSSSADGHATATHTHANPANEYASTPNEHARASA